MKNTTIAITLSTLITLSSNAQALELLVVDNYNTAASADIWKKAKTDQVPEALLSNVNVANPSASYASVFPKSFMQESLFAVCHQNCNNEEIFRLRNGEITEKDKSNWDVVEQSSVYYWLNKYFNFLDQKIQYRPDQYLKVMTNRELRDETRGKKMNNNAFFNPADVTLSFLPAKNSLFFKMMGGKMNRSGFDPSVVVHEASHYLFHHLFANPVNDEIGGLNEGFADYMANIFLNNPKIGLVMLHGRALRDSSTQVDGKGSIKMYEPGMEVHDLGERVSFALWKSRELSNSKEELDRLVIDAVKDLGRDPYASVHDFKIKMLERLPHVIDDVNMPMVSTIWETTIPDAPIKIDNTAFLNKPVADRPVMGFKTKQILPESSAKEMGLDVVTESNFSILQMEKISDKQIAILMGTEEKNQTVPYWIALDAERANVLGIFGADKNLVTDEEELKNVKFLADQAKGINAVVKDFKSKTVDFSDMSQGKGSFSVAYKLKSKTSASEIFTFNGTEIAGTRIKMYLKKKLLIGLLLGLPEIDSIELSLIPLETSSLHTLDGQRVIGYKINFKTGTSSEVLVDKLALQ